MDAARWNRLRELFDKVRDLPPDEQDAALREACGVDAELLADARALLAPASGDTDALLGGIVAEEIASLETTNPAGERVGPYRLVREIGQGGMGAVYLAERVDGQFEQEVALKLIKPGLATDQFLARFRAERQILARLQHPHIARLLDGGIDDQGRPYFALEYIEGEPIDRYCASRALPVNERLRLFQQACRAVTYAHANLVIHRDLKPAHILVTADGQVRLLDFGIAKVVSDDDDGGGGGGMTQLGIRAMTPAYASPEQIRAEAVGTATDVYSLGVILYELLTGVPPYDVHHRSAAEIERVVCDTVPPRPSSRVTEPRERARKRLRGDLDVICLKALQKEPDRRYSSVEAFQEDIRRNLLGLPVLARPDSLAYRASRFAGRHRLAFGAGVAAAVVFLSSATYFTIRLADERDLARVEAARADQVATFLQGLFEVSDPDQSKGETVTARELLDLGAERIQRELTSEPEVRSSMMRVIGEVYQGLGLFDRARPLLTQALEDQRRIYGDDHREVAASESALGVLLQDVGEVEDAEALFRQSLATRQRLGGDRDPDVSETMALLAYLLETRGDMVSAEAMAREVLAINQELFPAGGPRVAAAQANLAGMLRRQEQFDEAEPLLREALAAQRRIYGDNDLTVASTARNLASLLRDRGALDEAATLYEEAIATRRRILGDVHPEVAVALNSYAMLLDLTGDSDRAIAGYRELIRIQEQIHGDRPHPDLAAIYNNFGASLRAAGALDEAADYFGRAIAMVDAALEPGHPNRAYARVGLAGVRMDQRRFADASPLLRDAVAIRRGGLPEGHRYIGDALVELGRCLTALGRFADAERELLEAHQLFIEAVGATDSRTARARRGLAELYNAWGRPDDAARYADAGGQPGA